MNKKFLNFWIILGALLLQNEASAQYRWGVDEVSLSVSNAQWGLPFLQFTPMHPGLEAGVSVLANEQKNFRHDVSVCGGFFYHELMATAAYLNVGTAFQYWLGNVLGADIRAGAGYAHAFYPGEAYAYKENTGSFESTLANQSFLQLTAGVGISYLGFERVEPFVRMDVMMLNNLYNSVTLVKVGLKIPLK